MVTERVWLYSISDIHKVKEFLTSLIFLKNHFTNEKVMPQCRWK